MKFSFGICYLENSKSTTKLKKFYSVKKSKYSTNWIVYETFTDEIVMVLPTKLRAYYVATKYNGTDVSSFFKFGDIL